MQRATATNAAKEQITNFIINRHNDPSNALECIDAWLMEAEEEAEQAKSEGLENVTIEIRAFQSISKTPQTLTMSLELFEFETLEEE